MSGASIHRQRIGAWLDRLLDPACGTDEQIAVTTAWLEDWLALLAVDLEGEFADDLALPGGLAVSPLTAARCITDAFRTTQFLRALNGAIAAALIRFPGETIEVLEAGCGPLAALSLPLAVRHAGRPVRFTLLDANAVSLEHAARLAARLEVFDSVSVLQGDATQLALPRPPHIIVCELIQRGLTREPQAAATLNLGPQLKPGGVFLPAEITVSAALFDAAARFGAGESGVQTLGPVAVLTPAGLDMPEDIRIPPHDPRRQALSLLTTIRLDERHVIDGFEAAITFPEPVNGPTGLAKVGFDFGAAPGPRLT